MSLLLHLRFLFLLFQWPAAHRALHSFPTRRSSDLAVVTRVRRGDLELLARDDLVLEPGDRLAVVVDRRELDRSEEHTSELQSRGHLVCRLLLEKKKSRNSIH